jgi:hypothetical protein
MNEYDVVTDILTKHKESLLNISNKMPEWGIMDFIRMEQVDEIDQCLLMWKEYKNSINGV